MKINSNTKISSLIKLNPNSIDALVSVSTRFNKLKNPLLRGILASRTTIGDAAVIGRCDIELLFDSLRKIGFEVESDSNETYLNEKQQFDVQIEQAINDGKIISLDVRPTLERGGDPYNEIMGELSLLHDGYTLKVINSFEPTPLIKIAMNRGFKCFVDIDGELVNTYFIKTDTSEVVPDSEPGDLIVKISLDELLVRTARLGAKVVEVDVRDLEMPLPMITILGKLEELADEAVLFVHHKKIPQYLLPELADRNFKCLIAEVDDNNVKLLIHR